MKLLVIDGNSVLNRAFYGIRLLSTKEGIYTNAILGFLNILLKITDEISPDLFAVCFDVSRKTFRNEMYDDYKGTRKGMPDELRCQLPIIKELLSELGYKILGKEGFEADDLIGTISKKCEMAKCECVIATGDRDSFQLINDFVTVRLASTKQGSATAEMFDTNAIIEKYGVKPDQLIDVKAIMGDASDNIPGVKGIGEKGALKLISDYNTLEYIYDNVENLEIAKGMKEKLIISKDIAFLSKQLATIKCDVEIDCEMEDFKRKPINHQRVSELLTKLEMFSMYKKLGVEQVGFSQSKSEQSAVDKQDCVDVKITKQDNQDEFVKVIKNKEFVSVFFNEQFTEFSFFDGDNLFATNDIEIFKNIIQLCENQKLKIIVFDAKELYKFGYVNNIKINDVFNDVLLSAYLLNPSQSEYTIQNLVSTFLKLNADLSGCSDQEKMAVYLYYLSEEMLKQLDEFNQKSLLFDIELPLSKVLAEMEYEGFEIDKSEILKYKQDLEEEIASLQDKIYEVCGGEFNINSPKQLGEVLFERLNLPVIKKTKTGYSTNADVLEELKKYHPVIEDILLYRHLAKLNSTYTTAFIDLCDENSRIHSHFIQTETRTGRISSVSPNMQNIPVRTERGKEIRRFFKAKEGYTLVDADYSQIELRVLADIAGDEVMIEAFKNDEDIHTKTASEVFNIPFDFVNESMRRQAKAVNFGIVYGIGAFSLSGDIGVTVKEAKLYIDNYFKTYKNVKTYMDKTVEDAEQSGYTTTIFGRKRYIPELKATNKIQKAFGQRIAMNSPIQGSAADIIKIAMIKVYQKLKDEQLDAKLILQVHDELIVECKKEISDRVKEIVKQEMENAVSLKVPLLVDAHEGLNWFEAKN